MVYTLFLATACRQSRTLATSGQSKCPNMVKLLVMKLYVQYSGGNDDAKRSEKRNLKKIKC